MGVQFEIDFDYKAFEEILYKASFETFTDIQAKHTDETFYNFSLYSTAQLTYIVPTCNSEEGLERTVQRYFNDYYHERGEKEEVVSKLRIALRCSTPADFAYHSPNEYNTLYDKTDQLLTDFHNKVEATEENNMLFIGQEGRWEITSLLYSQLEVIILNVLSRLDSQQVFEKTNLRENVTLGLRFGDQSDLEIARYTSMLNPFDVYIKFMNELKRGNAIKI